MSIPKQDSEYPLLYLGEERPRNPPPTRKDFFGISVFRTHIGNYKPQSGNVQHHKVR